MIEITKKICMEKRCENECLINSDLCYLHNNIITPSLFKNIQLYERVYQYEYTLNDFNILKDFKSNIGKIYKFVKSWINDNTYTYIYH